LELTFLQLEDFFADVHRIAAALEKLTESYEQTEVDVRRIADPLEKLAEREALDDQVRTGAEGTGTRS